MNNYKLNWKPSPKDERDFKSLRKLLAPVTLPTEFKLDREIPVSDQLEIGSCVSNAACSAFRYEVAQLTNNFDFEPSRLFVYFNARKLQGWEREDSGAFIRDGFKSLNKWGVAKEETWKYDISKFAIDPPKLAYDDALNQIAVKYARVNQDLTAIKQTLVSGAAVSFGFNVYQSFFGSWSNKKDPIMPLPKSGEILQGGHAILAIGYSDSKKAFLIQNSWGTGWGDKGLFWMPYSFALNPNEADDFWCIEEIKFDQKVTPPTPTNLNWKMVSDSLFKDSKELYSVKKRTLIALGEALGVKGLDSKRNFNFNFNLVKTFLNL